MKKIHKILLGLCIFFLGMYIGFAIATYYYNQYQILAIGAGLGLLTYFGNPFNIMNQISNLFNRHDIKIVYNLGNPDIFNPKPILEEKIIGHKFFKRNIRLDIQNDGDITAEDCEVNFKLTKPMDFDKYPSKEAKILRWTRDNSTSMSLRPKSTDNLVYLVFLMDREIEDNIGYVSRPHNLDGPILHNKDGLMTGEYEFSITVYPAKGKPVKQSFKMEIGKDWNDFSLEQIK